MKEPKEDCEYLVYSKDQGNAFKSNKEKDLAVMLMMTVLKVGTILVQKMQKLYIKDWALKLLCWLPCSVVF